MNDVDDLLRAFRADMPDPDDGAPARIFQRARRAHPQHDLAATPHGRRRRSSRLRWVLLPVAVAGAVTLVLAIAPTGSKTGGAPSLLQRAEAAITAPNRIVALSINVRSTTNASGVVNPNRTIRMRQWTLAGAAHAMQMRILISEGPLARPPTDEDSTLLSDRTGRVVDQRSWTPIVVGARDNYDYPRGGGRGVLEIGGPVRRLDRPRTLVDRLVEAYRSGQLQPIGRTADGDLRLRLDLGPASSCQRTDVVLESKTLLPRRVTTTSSPKACGTGGRPTTREVSTISAARSLPATASNRRLLAIGDWPTARTVRWAAHGEPQPTDRVPAVPALDER
ncbi:MAG: hypothetical protein QOC86_2952 [Gaiellales bacterium]|jgi:hypothetical protein|nr:hypothetical protein [Gaiellales bacterium]